MLYREISKIYMKISIDDNNNIKILKYYDQTYFLPWLATAAAPAAAASGSK